MSVLKRYHRNRCDRKKAFRNGDLADKAAERASLRTGELIISYQCYDCGKWHIGHADAIQIALRQERQPPSWPQCIICNNPIPDARLMKAQRRGTRTRTCSKKCAKALQNDPIDPG